MKTILSIVIFVMSSISFGQQLTYTPKNPAFGGETFNYQWLLNSANAQNSFKDASLQIDDRSELDLFAESLNRQLLSQISRALIDDQFGDGVLEPGTSTFGNLELEVYESSEGLVINVLDITTGEQTQIVIEN